MATREQVGFARTSANLHGVVIGYGFMMEVFHLQLRAFARSLKLAPPFWPNRDNIAKSFPVFLGGGGV